MSTTTILPKSEEQARPHPTALVDKPLIARADEHLAAKSEFLLRSAAAYKQEQQALSVAREAAALAVRGEGGDPLKAALAAEEAARKERVAAKVLEAASDERRKASIDRENAQALALKPSHRAWRFRRLEAARAGDAADEAKARAIAAYDEATEELRKLTIAGLPDVQGALADPSFRGEEAERKLWADRGITDESPEHPWDPGKAA